MLPLNQILAPHCHIVTQVIEAEFVIRAKSNVAIVGSLTSVAIRLVLIDAVHRKAMEHVQRAHPLRVSFRQVIIDRDYMHSLSGQGIQEHRQGSHERFTLTGSHLCYFTLVQNDATYELNIVVNHVPRNLVAPSHPMVLVNRLIALNRDEIVLDAQVFIEISCRNFHCLVLSEPAGRGFHYRESFRKNFVESLLDCIVLILHDLIRLCCQSLLFIHRYILIQLLLDFGDALLERCFAFSQLRPKLIRLGPEFVIRQFIYWPVCRKDLIQDRFQLFHVPVRL